jgi:outer membrane protein
VFAIGLVAVSLAATPLTLEEVRAASRQQLDAVRAELDVQRASQNTVLARSVIFPQVNVNFNAGLNVVGPSKTVNTVPQYDPDTQMPVLDSAGNPTYVQTVVTTPTFAAGRFGLSLSVNQLIYDGGKWWTQIAQAGAQEEAAKGQLAEQQLSSELEAARRFYDLLKAQLSLKVFEATVVRSQEQFERAKALYEAGKGTRGSVFDAQTNVGNDVINVIRQRQRIVQARLSLLQWIGRPDADVEAVPPAGLETPASLPSVDQFLDTAKQKRPLFASLEQNVKSAQLGVPIAWSTYLPRISASASYNRNAPSANPFFTDFSQQNSFSVGANLSWDIFTGLSTGAQVKQAEVEVSRAKVQQQQLLLDLEAELRRAHDSARAEVEVLKISENGAKISEAQLKLEEERFAAGAGSTIEVRNAQVKFTQSQLSVLSGRADVAVARAALVRSAGSEIP